MVDSITDDHGQALASYELEPVLITGLSEDANRTKRRLVTYDEIPQNLVQAVLAIEDRRFFEHGGVNYFRLMEAVCRDVTTGQKQQGGSTLTMQLARGFFLTPEKRIKRKIIEIVITFQLEHRFTKKQIFEMYANQINLGQRGSFCDQRLRRGLAGLLRQGRAPARSGRVRAAGGHDPAAQLLLALPPSGPRHRAPQPGARLHG